MCGRFTLRRPDKIKLDGSHDLGLPFDARFNIAPTQSILAYGDFGHGKRLAALVWGLIPSWSIDGKGFINARCESLDQR